MNGSNISHGNDTASIPAFLSQGDSTRTVIGADSNFMGDISIREGQDLYIEGCVVGNVFHGGKVVIASSGMVIGSIFAAHLEVHGVVDAPDGEILAANLVVHGTSRVTASEVTVAAGCMNYERGGFMSAQMGMLSESEVKMRIDTLLQEELSRAQEHRASIERARNAARELRAPIARAATVSTVSNAAAFVAEVVEQAPAPAPAPAPAASSAAGVVGAAVTGPRPAMALVPAIVELDADESADSVETARAYAA